MAQERRSAPVAARPVRPVRVTLTPQENARRARQALANNPKLRANRRRARRKANLVLAGSTLAFLVPALLLAGTDLSGWLYPSAPEEDTAGGAPDGGAAPTVVGPGSEVTMQVVGTLENGTEFLNDAAFEGTIGGGSFVPGLERAISGLAPGAPFDVTVAAPDGFGEWNSSRTSYQSRNYTRSRLHSMEVGNFDDRWGDPAVGMTVPTSRWPSTVTSVGEKYVRLAYQPVNGSSVRLFKYWNSTVTGFNETKIFLQHEMWVGYNYTKYSSSLRTNITMRVVSVTQSRYNLDYNHPLAGQTLHFRGVVTDVRAGSGPATMAPPGTATGAVSLMSGQSCRRCHGGFVALDASALAVRQGNSLQVNVTVEGAWKHELTGVSVVARAGGDTGPGGQAGELLPDIATGEAATAALVVPGPAGNGTLEITVNATAYHKHRSSSSHDESVYQLRVVIPVAGAGDNVTVAGAATPQAPSGRAEPGLFELEDPLAILGRAAGFVALGLCTLPAFQGGKRHAKLAPRFRTPPWLTTHFALSLAAIVVSVTHGVVLMSGSYRGEWTVDILAGVAGLVILGFLGVSGVVLAKWLPVQWEKVRKYHFALMAVMVAAGAVHVVVSSTTLHDLIGY